MMKLSGMALPSTRCWVGRLCFLMLIAALVIGPIAPACADPAPLVGAPSDSRVTAFAMRWFTEIQAGRTDPSLYAPGFAEQVTDEAVRKMSHDLNRYGASPLGAEVVQTQKRGEQKFYIVKFVFPRGDAASLLFGIDTAGRITGIGVQSMAGD